MVLQIAFLLAAAFSAIVAAERVAVQAGKSFCFFEDLKANSPWGIQFQSDEHEIRVVVRTLLARLRWLFCNALILLCVLLCSLFLCLFC